MPIARLVLVGAAAAVAAPTERASERAARARASQSERARPGQQLPDRLCLHSLADPAGRDQSVDPDNTLFHRN